MDNPFWYQYFPVVLNVTYGDPFIPAQIDDTIEKIKDMRDQKVPIALLTKAPYNEQVIDKLKEVADHPMLLPFYSLTGLNEGGYSMKERIRMVEALEKILIQPTIILTRPIIRGRNDSPEILQTLVDVAANNSKLLVLGGVHDVHKNKNIHQDVESQLIEMCAKADVKCFHKSSCCVSYLQGKPECSMHGKNALENLGVASALGYRFRVEENQVILDKASTGDLNFLRLLTKSEVMADELISNYNLLTISTSENLLECTSSWFAWSRNLEECLGCNYCIILQLEYLQKKKVKIGMNSRDLLKATGTQNFDLFSSFKSTKLKKYQEPVKGYEQVRVAKPCFLHRYPAYRGCDGC